MIARLKLVVPEAEGGLNSERLIVPPIRRPVLPDDAEHRREFHSPTGAERGGPPIRQYYNPRPGVLAKKRRFRKAGAALFARHGVSAIGFDRVAGLCRRSGANYYHGRNELLAEIIGEHLETLTAALAASHDAHAGSVPEVLLEALIRAWLDASAASRTSTAPC